ncbi:LysR family transcriptional regulator [Trinickia caryophylli]|uniref:Transcriptional regulator, LysR family n=1 Tax=Trinickia caryophylli TaxID=28094 RepID=A0A1X7FDQ2_TRICW|nr:LysR family transcriptional regulator [Trinickia caryophylli]PMS10867.1 LysR family transcriptional regulator [Trinickia caryophylli]TRX18810.1 LysR family transcriptional regulator [Trinickia caryophylli]WQE10391.1 LysR family transcriptional regulator [Trinickia caryophylli]SMF50031.1 transcriptional regulator, LysR family [Trinickia caryophylli]GLU34159.1 transcriptional regulator [Trinickia caryophylli]
MNSSVQLSLAHLRAVRLVADTGSVSQAASALYRAQSAVSRAVQEIEAELGEALFDRKPSGMLPTAAGRVVLERSERVFAELEALDRWCATRQSRTRSLKAGMPVPAFLLNTRRLQVFSELAKHKHMPSAAHALGITQPAVSSAIRILESGAGMPLFHRNPRGLLLTADGETFLLHVRRALNELRHVADDIAALRGTVQGSVTVGALPLGRTLILPAAIARVSMKYPGVRVVTDESAYETLVAGVRAGDIDFILGALRANDAASGLENERLMSEDLVVLARYDHPLAGRGELALKDLADARWILPRSHAPARALIEAMFKRARVKPPMPSVETADLAVIRGVLLRTDMVAAVSAQQLHYEVQAGQLTVLDVPTRATSRDIGLTLRAAGTPSPAARALIDAIRVVVGEVSRTTRVAFN